MMQEHGILKIGSVKCCVGKHLDSSLSVPSTEKVYSESDAS